MGLILSKGQGQGQVKSGPQIKMMHESHATHVLWVIWDVEFDGDTHFKFDRRKGMYLRQAKLGQIRSDFHSQKFL